MAAVSGWNSRFGVCLGLFPAAANHDEDQPGGTEEQRVGRWLRDCVVLDDIGHGVAGGDVVPLAGAAKSTGGLGRPTIQSDRSSILVAIKIIRLRTKLTVSPIIIPPTDGITESTAIPELCAARVPYPSIFVCDVVCHGLDVAGTSTVTGGLGETRVIRG